MIKIHFLKMLFSLNSQVIFLVFFFALSLRKPYYCNTKHNVHGCVWIHLFHSHVAFTMCEWWLSEWVIGLEDSICINVNACSSRSPYHKMNGLVLNVFHLFFHYDYYYYIVSWHCFDFIQDKYTRYWLHGLLQFYYLQNECMKWVQKDWGSVNKAFEIRVIVL